MEAKEVERKYEACTENGKRFLSEAVEEFVKTIRDPRLGDDKELAKNKILDLLEKYPELKQILARCVEICEEET